MKTKKILTLILSSYIVIYFVLETELSYSLPSYIQFISNIKHITIFLPILLLFLSVRSKTKAFLFSISLFLFAFYKPHFYNLSKCINLDLNQQGKVIKIGTFNLAGNSITKNEVDNLILNENLDIVGFQEVPNSFIRSNTFEYLKKYLNYSIYNQNESGYWTQLTLSKFELVNNNFLDPGNGFTSRDARITIESQINIYNHLVSLLNNHLSIPFNRSNNCKGLNCLFSNYNQYDRDNQLLFLKNYIQGKKGNFILIGDFNLSDQNYTYIKFSENLIDSGACSPRLNYTWSNEFFLPIIRLDYVFVKNDQNLNIIPISSKTIKFEKSDHLGIITEIKLL